MKTSPTYAMIASACGVNVSTVSRALNNNPLISASTREKVLGTAKEMGWKVNPLVSVYMTHLRSGREIVFRMNLAYIIPFPKARKISDLPGYHVEHFEGCKAQAADLGYGLEAVWFEEWGGSGAKLTRLLKNRGIRGAIFHGPMLPHPFYKDFDWDSFAVAAWGCASPDYPLHLSAAHYSYDMRLMLSRIRKYGYSRIALMLFETQDELSEHGFYASYLYEKTFDDSGVSYDYLRLPDTISEKSRKRLAKEWLEKKQPDLVIGEQIVWELLHEMGWKVPERIGYVSVCWSPGWTQIAGIDQRAEAIGRNAIDLVAGQLMRNERGLPRNPKLLLSKGVWVDGSSCLDRRTAAPVAEAAVPSLALA